MYEFLNVKSVNKSEAYKALKEIKKVEKINPQLKGFNIKSVKNNRGDYGHSDLYFYQGIVYMILDIDGAHRDIQYYLSNDFKNIISSMERAAKSK